MTETRFVAICLIDYRSANTKWYNIGQSIDYNSYMNLPSEEKINWQVKEITSTIKTQQPL